MKLSFAILCALSLSAGIFVIGDASPTSTPTRVLAPQPAAENCKPDAPIKIELLPADLVGSRARLDYVLTPVMDALAVEVTVSFPQGGELRWHNAPSRAATERGRELNGAISAELPLDRPGVEVEVRAYISIPDPEAPDGIGVYTTTRTATWGEVDRRALEVTEVVIENELTLDTPATHL